MLGCKLLTAFGVSKLTVVKTSVRASVEETLVDLCLGYGGEVMQLRMRMTDICLV